VGIYERSDYRCCYYSFTEWRVLVSLYQLLLVDNDIYVKTEST
jgi:hypothetical protein